MEGTFTGTGAWFRNTAAHASAHYGISVDGAIARYVSDEFEAWHAGAAEYNARSIGIELEGHSDDPDAFTDPMMDALVWLSTDLCDRYGIPADRDHFIGHNEVPDPRCPGQFGGAGHHRDPGPYFNWIDFMARLSGAGAGVA